MYCPALEAAAKLFAEHAGAGRGSVLLLSDGRPGDAKGALAMVQRSFVPDGAPEVQRARACRPCSLSSRPRAN